MRNLTMKIMWVAFASMIFAAPTFAGGREAGNGGKGVVCRDPSGKVTSVRLLDFYEADVRGIEIDLGAAATPTLTAFAIIDAALAPANQFIAKVFRQQIPSAGTQFDFTTLDRRDYLTQVSLYPDSGSSQQTSEVDMRFNSQIIDELTTPVRLAALINRDMSPAATGRTANITDIVMEHDESLISNLLAGALNLNGAQDLSMTIKAANAMSGTIIGLIEKIGPPE